MKWMKDTKIITRSLSPIIIFKKTRKTLITILIYSLQIQIICFRSKNPAHPTATHLPQINKNIGPGVPLLMSESTLALLSKLTTVNKQGRINQTDIFKRSKNEYGKRKSPTCVGRMSQIIDLESMEGLSLGKNCKIRALVMRENKTSKSNKVPRKTRS